VSLISRKTARGRENSSPGAFITQNTDSSQYRENPRSRQGLEKQATPLLLVINSAILWRIMSIHIKTPDEVEKMCIAGHLAADVLVMIEPYVQEGITTEELDRLCHDYITQEQQAIAAPLNYHGFPKSICTSVNHQVCHGIPGKRALKNGDIINIDITVIKDGYHGDTSKMFSVGETSVIARRVSRISHECLCIGIEMVRPGIHLGDIGHAIQRHAEAHNTSIVR